MSIVTTFRIIRIFTFTAVLTFCSGLRAQPAGGKWTETPKLPLLTSGRMVFADSMTGYYIGIDTGYVTKNGGLTWTLINFPASARPAPTYLSAPDHNTVISFQQYYVDSNGVQFPGVINSTDQGSSWNLVSIDPLFQGVKALTMWTANDGFRIWLDDSYKDHCAVTHDGGKTFTDIRGDATLEKYISQFSVSSVSLTMKSDWSDSLHGVIAFSTTKTPKAYPVLLTSDGGRSWSEHYMKYNGDSTILLSKPYLFHGSESVWVLVASPVKAQYVYYSPDFGMTWTTTNRYTRSAVLELAPVSATATWAACASDSSHAAISANVIAYKDYSNISSKWITDTVLSGGTFFHKFTLDQLQFTDPYHGWVRAFFAAGIDTTFHDPFAYFFRFTATAPNSVPVSFLNSHLCCIPNPASSIMKIEGFASDEKVRVVKLTNALGKQSSPAAENIGTGIDLDIRGLPNGCYFVTITTSLRTENIPVMVMH
jgi:hypothetical protein